MVVNENLNSLKYVNEFNFLKWKQQGFGNKQIDRK